MKKSLYLLPLMIVMLSACGNKQADVGTSAKVEDSTVNTSQNENSSTEEASQKDDNTTKDGQRVDKEFGSFIVAEGFGEAKEQSGGGRYFYVVEGHEHDARPNNISINTGHQNYNLDESEKFAESTTWQLNMQIKQYGMDAVVYGSSGKTDAGDIMYIFDIKFNDSDEVDRQYYILRDKKYVMVFMSNFDGDESVNKAAELMAKSFEWK
jgi:lipoprotein